MSLILVKVTFIFIFITVRDVKSELDPIKVVGAGFEIAKSLNDSLESAKSTVNFVTLLLFDNKEDDTSKSLIGINDKLHEISENLESFERSINITKDKKTLELHDTTKSSIEKFFSLGRKIDKLYKDYLAVRREVDPLDPTLEQLYELNHFIDVVFKYGVEKILEEMHFILYKKASDIAYEYAKIFSEKFSTVCSKRFFESKIIPKFYLTLQNAEFKGLSALVYAQKQYYGDSVPKVLEEELYNILRNFNKRTREAFTAQKEVMNKIARELWDCTLDSPRRGFTYEQFGPFIYKTFESAQTLTPSYPPHWCINFKDVESLCRKQPTYKPECNEYAFCRGKIKSCEKLGNDAVVCQTSNDKARKYEYAEIGVENYGKKEKSCSGKLYKHTSKPQMVASWLTYIESYDGSCLCTCEIPDPNAYINLREVVSDVHENKVITGIRFRKVHNIFHLQVQQAKLLPSASIDPKTKSWVKVEDYKTTDSDVSEGEDYHKLSWDLRSFQLDDVEVDENFVVTGVRFTLNEGLLRLNVKGTVFNYATGKLETNEQFWYQHNKTRNQLKQFKLEHTDLPPTHSINKDVSYSDSNQYITLTTSSMEQDVGQTVVPFVDLHPVVSENPDVALSGVGIFHKGYKKKAAGYLSVKILTYR